MSGVRDKGTIWALIPVKEFGSAKSRLRTVLNGDECAGLALNMVRDVAAAITGSEVVNGLSLLGSGPEIEKLADELHCECMEEFYDVDFNHHPMSPYEPKKVDMWHPARDTTREPFEFCTNCTFRYRYWNGVEAWR